MGNWSPPIENYYNHIIPRGITADHKGVDVGYQLVDDKGNPINQFKKENLLAVTDATVMLEGYGRNVFANWIKTLSVKDQAIYGAEIVIWLKLDNGWIIKYGHCESTKVNAGQRVKRGEVIGLMGSTGNSTAPHLHLEIEDRAFSPYRYYDFRPQLTPRSIGSIGPTPTVSPEFVTVQAGWGISNITQLLGWSDWATESAWNRIANLNGFPTYKQMTLSVGQQVRVKAAVSIPVVAIKETQTIMPIDEYNNVVAEKNALQDKINALSTDLTNTKKDLEDYKTEASVKYFNELKGWESQEKAYLAQINDLKLQSVKPTDEDYLENEGFIKTNNKLEDDNKLLLDELEKAEAISNQLKIDKQLLQQQLEEAQKVSMLTPEQKAVLEANPHLKEIAKGILRLDPKLHLPSNLAFKIEAWKNRSKFTQALYHGAISLLGLGSFMLLEPLNQILTGDLSLPANIAHVEQLGLLGATVGIWFVAVQRFLKKNALAIGIIQMMAAESFNIWKAHHEKNVTEVVAERSVAQ